MNRRRPGLNARKWQNEVSSEHDNHRVAAPSAQRALTSMNRPRHSSGVTSANEAVGTLANSYIKRDEKELLADEKLQKQIIDQLIPIFASDTAIKPVWIRHQPTFWMKIQEQVKAQVAQDIEDRKKKRIQEATNRRAAADERKRENEQRRLANLATANAKLANITTATKSVQLEVAVVPKDIHDRAQRAHEGLAQLAAVIEAKANNNNNNTALKAETHITSTAPVVVAAAVAIDDARTATTSKWETKKSKKEVKTHTKKEARFKKKWATNNDSDTKTNWRPIQSVEKEKEKEKEKTTDNSSSSAAAAFQARLAEFDNDEVQKTYLSHVVASTPLAPLASSQPPIAEQLVLLPTPTVFSPIDEKIEGTTVLALLQDPLKEPKALLQEPSKEPKAFLQDPLKEPKALLQEPSKALLQELVQKPVESPEIMSSSSPSPSSSTVSSVGELEQKHSSHTSIGLNIGSSIRHSNLEPSLFGFGLPTLKMEDLQLDSIKKPWNGWISSNETLQHQIDELKQSNAKRDATIESMLQQVQALTCANHVLVTDKEDLKREVSHLKLSLAPIHKELTEMKAQMISYWKSIGDARIYHHHQQPQQPQHQHQPHHVHLMPVYTTTATHDGFRL